MKTLTFTYTKKDGSTSERTLLAMVTPGGDKYAGIDISEIEPNVAAAFAKDAEILYRDYLNAMKELQTVYDLNHAYRQFLVSGMTNVTEI